MYVKEEVKEGKLLENRDEHWKGQFIYNPKQITKGAIGSIPFI